MIVKDVETIIGKCLASVVNHVDEIIIVDTGSTDASKDVIRKIAPHAKILDFTHETHPNAFLHDVLETWDGKIPGPFTGKHMLADFGAARQWGWKEARTDYAMWIDSDDILVGGEHLPEVLANMREENLTLAILNYDYSHDRRGNPTCKLKRERIAKMGIGIDWQQPIHELFVPLGMGKFYDKVNIVHKRGEYGINPSQHHRNLKVLFHWAKQAGDKVDPRILFYLAMEERFIWPERAITDFKNYCVRSGWDEERAVAHYHAGMLHEKFERKEEALAEYALAALEFPDGPEGLFGAARVAYLKRDWGKCIEYTERGFAALEKKNGRESMIFYDPLDRVYKPYVYYSVALVETGNFERAIEACDKGLKWNPEDPHLIGNKEFSEKVLKERKEGKAMAGKTEIRFKNDDPLDAPSMSIPLEVIATFAIQMWKRNMEAKNYVRALQFIDALPENIGREKRLSTAREMTIKRLKGLEEDAKDANIKPAIASAMQGAVMLKTEEPTEEAREISDLKTIPTVFDAGRPLDIVIWTGAAWEKWSPKNIETTGIGGSETAAACMAREFAMLGHRVRMISDIGGDEGVYDGVSYEHFEKITNGNLEVKCDVLIVSRQVLVLHYERFVAPIKVLWVHDVHVGEPSGPVQQAILKADKIFALSEWHKKFLLETYSFLPASAVTVTRNSIDLERFAKTPVKAGNKLIYSSSPDRGLLRLLEYYPEIKKEVPDLELHIYYGFDTWESMARQYGNQEQLDKIKYFRNKIAEMEPVGVKYHGRVNQRQLADAFLRSKVWAFPSWFTETSCISAMEAQAAGCVPVATKLAALEETVHHGYLIRPPDTHPRYAKAFIPRVIQLLKDEELRSHYADAGRKYAFAHYGWDKVAQEWVAMFRAKLQGKDEATDVPEVPEFREVY